MIRNKVITCDTCGSELTKDQVHAIRFTVLITHGSGHREWRLVTSRNRHEITLAQRHICKVCASDEIIWHQLRDGGLRCVR
jgi:hypothetical protein